MRHSVVPLRSRCSVTLPNLLPNSPPHANGLGGVLERPEGFTLKRCGGGESPSSPKIRHTVIALFKIARTTNKTRWTAICLDGVYDAYSRVSAMVRPSGHSRSIGCTRRTAESPMLKCFLL